MKSFEKFLMLGTFSLAFLGIIGLVPQIISGLLWVSLLIYLFFGWKLLSPLKTWKIQLLPFLISYLIAQTVVVVLFGINNYPIKFEFSYITSAILFIAIIALLVFNKTLKIKYPDNTYLTRLVVCIMFSLTPLWMDAFR